MTAPQNAEEWLAQLLKWHEALIEIHGEVRMDTVADRELHDRVMSTYRTSAALVRDYLGRPS